MDADRCFKICIGDLNKKAEIVLRKIQPPKVGKSKATMSFTSVAKSYFKIQTVQGTRRFNGVSINKNTTHIFICRYQKAISSLDGAGEYFISYSGRYFRIGPITNINEQNRWILLQASERGYDSKEESNA